jgi:hypothetical protein
MATIQSTHRAGDICGWQYVFEDIGDGVRTRAHIVGSAHSVVVIAGSVEITAEGEEPITVLEGQVGSFNWCLEHIITALQPNTIALNLMIFGTPERTDNE